MSIGSAALVAILNYALNVILGWSLPVDEYGRVGVSQTIIFVCVWFLGAGLPWVVTRAVAEARGGEPTDAAAGAVAWRTYKTGWLANTALTFLVVALLLVAQSLGWLRLEPSYTPLIVSVAITVVALGINAVPSAGLQGLFRFGRIAIARVFEVGTNIVISVTLVILGFGAAGALAGFAASAVLATGLSVWLMRDKHFWLARGWGGLSTVRAAVPLTLAVFGGVLLTNVDVLAVKFLSAPESSDSLSGSYQVAAVLARAPLFVGTALVNVFYPRIAERARIRGQGEAAARDLLRWLALAVLPLNVVMMICAPAVVLFLFPERYGSAASSLAVLAAGSALLTWATGLAASYQALGRTRGPAVIMTGAVLVQLIGLAWLVPPFGMLGAATASAAASLLACVALITWRHGLAVMPSEAKRHALALAVLALAAVPLGTFAAHADRLAVALVGWLALDCYVAACCMVRVVCAEHVRGVAPPDGWAGNVAHVLVSMIETLNRVGRRWEDLLAGREACRQ